MKEINTLPANSLTKPTPEPPTAAQKVYKQVAVVGVSLGIGIQFIARLFLMHTAGRSHLGSILLSIGYIDVFLGCWFYARYKGYSGIFGFLGLMWLFGFVALIVLPRKPSSRHTAPTENPEPN